MGNSEALRNAARDGNEAEALRLVLEEGARVNAPDQEAGWTPLHFAAWNGHPDLIEALLYEGAHVDVRAKGGATALHVACRQGNADAVTLLLSKGARAHVQTNLGETPLDMAVKKGHRDVIAILDPSASDQGEDTTPSIAAADPPPPGEVDFGDALAAGEGAPPPGGWEDATADDDGNYDGVPIDAAVLGRVAAPGGEWPLAALSFLLLIAASRLWRRAGGGRAGLHTPPPP